MRSSFTCLVLSFLFYATAWFTLNRMPFHDKDMKTEREECDADENPKARMEWELKRLIDPATGKLPAAIFERELEFASFLPSDRNEMKRSADWIPRGPWNVGGRTRALAVDVANENIIIAGAVSGGIWRSEDSGTSWNKITPQNALQSVSCIVQDKRKNKTTTWYYGTGELYGASASATGAFYFGNGIYKSTDNGLSWKSLTSTASNTPNSFDIWDGVWNIAVDPSKDTNDVVYAATYGTIFRSPDGGAHWQAQLGGISPNYSYFTDVEVTPHGTAYATLSSEGYQKGIWRSVNGTKWTNITPDSFPAKYDRMVIGIDPNNENKVYILAHTTGYGKYSVNYRGEKDWNSLWCYMYISGDTSTIKGYWKNLSNNMPAKGTNSFDDYTAQGSYNMVVQVKPGDSNTVFIGGTNIYRSTDAFTTSLHTIQIGGYEPHTKLPNWHVYLNHHPDQHVLTFLPSNPNILFSGNDGGVFKTSDCTADTVVWQPLNHGYITTQAYTVNADQFNENDVLISGFQDNGNYFSHTSDAQASWVMPLNGDGSYSAIAPGGSFYILSKQLGKMTKMTLDQNGNKVASRRIDPIGGWDYEFINPFCLDPNDNNILYLAEGRKIWRNDQVTSIPLTGSNDSISQGWLRFKDSITSVHKFTAISVSKTPANRLYLGTDGRDIYRVDNANTGIPSLIRLPFVNLPAGGNVSCMALDPSNADNLMIVYSNYNIYSLYYSSDGGYTRKKVAGNLEQHNNGSGNGPSLRWASIMHFKGKTLYLTGTSIGLFATDSLKDTSTVWKQIGANTIGNSIVDMIVCRESDGLIAIATHGNGVFSTHITSVEDFLGVKMPGHLVRQEARLFPNPAKSYTMLEINEAVYGMIDLEIFDQAGRLKSRNNFFNSSLSGVRHKIDLNGFVPGVYMVYIKTKAKTYSARLLVAG